MTRLDRALPTRNTGPGAPMRRVLLAAGLAVMLLPACRLVEPVSAPPVPVAVAEGPALVDGVSDPAEAREVAMLLTQGEELLDAGSYAAARDVAIEVATRFPAADGSSLSLLLRSRASQGLEDWQDADLALGEFLALVSPTDIMYSEALIERSGVRRDGGISGGLEMLFDLPFEVPPQAIAAAEADALEWAGVLDLAELRDLVQEAPRHPLILPVFLGELSVRRSLSGADGEAREFAEAALALSPGEATAERARSVLEGRIAGDVAVSAVIGAILPTSGSPSMQQLAAEIREGIEVALATAERDVAGPVRFLTVDGSGGAAGMRSALDELEREGVMGIIGPLDEGTLDTAARSGGGLFPILSPTARMVPDGVGGAFSLTGVDPEAGQALASLVLSRGVNRVVVIHPSTQEMMEEARWFDQAFRSGGGTIVRTLTYPPGTTGFASQIQEVRSLSPSGLVMILPQSDVGALAPQIAFYQRDQVESLTRFGNEAWTSPPVLESIQPRLTDGVLAVTSWAGENEFGPAWNEFVSAYESHFQRTLRSPVPALGYDATRLLLLAARLGGGTPAGTLRAFQDIREFPGATGLLSVVDGRVHRSYVPVRIENRRLIPLNP
jgi:ABC-type branched-subunit amino acid transport system substrate-binding protein